MEEKLRKLLNNSYCPYSKFMVSSIVVMRDGNEFGGVNVENASYGSTLCAERNAIASAVANGYQKGDFKELHVMTTGDISTCCFACRQVIVELFESTGKIFCYNDTGDKKVYTVKELCPYPLSGSDLE